ncbi:hypothetical protein Tco_1561605 [Tanacetum coccineum]
MPDTEDTIIFKLDSQEIVYTMDMVGYQGVVDKVSAFYTNNLAQPWQKMFKVFNRCLTTRTYGHDSTKIHTFFKDVIQYPRFTKLIIADLMKKFSNIPQRIDEDYHSIKDDVPLVSVYTTGNVLVRGMLILEKFLTEEIRATNDYKDYETVFVNVVVPMNQPQLVIFTQGTHRSTPRAHRTPTLTTASPQGKKRKQSVDEGEKDAQSYDDVDDFDNRLKPESHKENPEYVDDDNDKEDEKVDEKEGNETGSLEIRTEKMQTPIPTTPRSPRINLSSDKNIIIEEVFKQYGQNNVIQVHPTTTTSTDTTSSTDLQKQLYLKMKRSLQDRANDITLWEVLKRKFEKSSISNTSCRDDAFNSQHHDDHQDDDAPPEGEKRVKRQKTSKTSKSARGSSWKRPVKDSITYVSKQQQQQEWDAWVEETIINKDEVIPEDETPKLITEFQNVDKRVPTIFDRARIDATLNDMNPNEPPRYLYNKDLFSLKNGNTEEKKYILSPHKIHSERFLEADLEEKMNRWGIEAQEPYSIIDKPTTGLIYLNNKDEKWVMYLVEILKFCDATLEKVLKEVKLKIFKSKRWKKPPLLGELDRDIMRALERGITKRLSHREQMRRWESFVNGRPILPTMKCV